MNDFDYENMQKKRIASGSRHKKNGSKSRKCTLPSDYLTPGQLKKRNGGIVSMNMNEPMKWDAFRKLSADLQKEYLKDKARRFALCRADVAAMMGVTAITLNKRVAELGLLNGRLWPEHGYPAKSQRKAFRDWVSQSWPTFEWDNKCAETAKECVVAKAPAATMVADISPVVVKDAPAPVVEQPTAVISSIKKDMMSVPSLAMSFVGKLNINQIANTIMSVAKDKNVLVKIVVEEVTGNE